MPVYDPAAESDERTYPVNLRLTAEQKADVEFFAILWTKLDGARGVRGAERRSLSSVISRLIDVSLAAAWAEVGGRAAVGDRDRLLRELMAKQKR